MISGSVVFVELLLRFVSIVSLPSSYNKVLLLIDSGELVSSVVSCVWLVFIEVMLLSFRSSSTSYSLSV